MAHYDENFHLQVMHSVLKGGMCRCVQTIARYANHEHVSEALIEYDFDRHTGIGATQDRDGRKLLRDQGSPLEGALLWTCCSPCPETHVALLQVGKHFAWRTVHCLFVA